MGYYIETEDIRHEKALWLINYHDARLENKPFFDPTGKRVGLCVVENGPFDAVAIAYSQAEMERFVSGTGDRPYIWLSLERDKVIRMNPTVASLLPPIDGLTPEVSRPMRREYE